MVRPVLIVSLTIFLGLFSSTLCTINIYQLDSNALKEYTLLDIAEAIAHELPQETAQIMTQLNLTEKNDASHPDLFNFFSLANDSSTPDRCTICTTIFRAVVASILSNTYDSVVNGLVAGCYTIINTINEKLPGRVPTKADQLCNGTIHLHAPHVREVLADSVQGCIAQAECRAAEFCTNLNLCIPESVTSSSVLEPEYQPIAANQETKPNKQQSVESSDDGVISVVQLTDIHIEPQYKQGSPTDCGLPVCCLEKWTGDGKGSANGVAEYTCNMPQHTVELFLSKVEKFNPDIILFSGDIPPHTIWDETDESQTNCTRLLTESIRRTLTNRKVYPCIGNHETYPTNLFSQVSLNYTKGFVRNFFEMWQPISDFSSQNYQTILDGGYYSKLIREGLRLLAYNSNYMYTFNWYNTLNMRNKTGVGSRTGEVYRMKRFMSDELANAKRNGEKVILLGHHPIGGSDFIVSWSRWYQQLVNQYSDIIVLQPTGHTHLDEIRLIYNSSGHPSSVVLVSPSISSGGTKNPSMRIFYLNNRTYELIDYEQYFLDINLNSRRGIQRESKAIDLTDAIRLLYSAKSAYQMPDLSPASWHNLTERFMTEPGLLQKHLAFSDAFATEGQQRCGDKCQYEYVCRQRNADFDNYTKCKDTYVSSPSPQATGSATLSPPTGSATLSPPTGLSSRFSFSSVVIVFSLICILGVIQG